MKFLVLFKSILFYVFLPVITLASWYVQHEKAPHGGILKQSDGYFIELRKADKYMYVYLLDSRLKTVTGKDLSGDVKFFLPDNTILPVNLKTISEEGFLVEMPAAFKGCQVNFIINKTPVSALFEKQYLESSR
ncbi:MAG: hypothetical protein JNL60_00805 [Bacteroidia bacterium]|nr:hypothetical protein [Bacteroidia bacterium]